MAKMGNSQSMWDLPRNEANINPLDDWAKSPERGGHINLKNENDIAYMQKAIGGIMSGEISEEGAMNIANRVKGSAPHIFAALGERKRVTAERAAIGNFFNPGSPAVPDRQFTDADQGTGVGPLMLGTPIPGTGKPAVGPKSDYAGAINYAMSRSNIDLADRIAKIQKESTIGGGKGLYGGIQYAYNPTTKQYVAYSVDETTRQAVPINPPQGTIPTVSMVPQVTQGGAIQLIPAKGAPGIQPVITPAGVSAPASAEEAKQTGQAQTAFDMGLKMRELVTSDKVKVGPVDGRRLRVSGVTGYNLTDDDATMISMEQNLSNQLLEAMRGAQVGPAEQKMFEKSLPRVDQPKTLFLKNIEVTMNNLATLRESQAKMRPVPAAPERIREKTSTPTFTADEIRAELARRQKEKKQ